MISISNNCFTVEYLSLGYNGIGCRIVEELGNIMIGFDLVDFTWFPRSTVQHCTTMSMDLCLSKRTYSNNIHWHRKSINQYNHSIVHSSQILIAKYECVWKWRPLSRMVMRYLLVRRFWLITGIPHVHVWGKIIRNYQTYPNIIIVFLCRSFPTVPYHYLHNYLCSDHIKDVMIPPPKLGWHPLWCFFYR